MSPCKLKKRLEMGINIAAKGGARGMWGEGCRRSVGGMSLQRAKRARKDFEGILGGEGAQITLGVPQHASLISPVADIPSPTS